MVSTSLRSQEGSQSSQKVDCGHVCGHVRDDCYELPIAASDPNQVNRGLDATFLFSVDCSADCGLTQIRTSCGKLLRLTRQISNVIVALQHDFRGLRLQVQPRHSRGASRCKSTGRPTRFRLPPAHCIGLLLACLVALQHGLRGLGLQIQHSPGHEHNTVSDTSRSDSHHTETTSTETAAQARRLAVAGGPTNCGDHRHTDHLRYLATFRDTECLDVALQQDLQRSVSGANG